MSKVLKGLNYTEMNMKHLRRYAAPINVIQPTDDGGWMKATHTLKKGTCQVISGLGIFPISMTDEQLDKEFEDVIMVRKSELIRFINSKKP